MSQFQEASPITNEARSALVTDGGTLGSGMYNAERDTLDRCGAQPGLPFGPVVLH